MMDYIQKRIGYSIALFAFLLAAIAFFHFLVVRQYSFLQILKEPSVSLVILTGILVLLTGIFKNSFTRFLQVMLFYITGLLPGLDAIPGNLTSAIFIGFSLLLLNEYNFLKKHYFLKLFLFLGFYIFSVFYGFITRSAVPISNIIHTSLGLLLALYLFYIMVEIRTLRHQRIKNELDGMVKERTATLHEKMREIEEYQGQLEETLEEKNKLLGEKNLLLQELHHRTKNNIQLIQSLLDLEKDKVSDQNAINVIAKTRNRVRAISVVHEFMYQTEQLVSVSLNRYIENLLSDLWQIYYNPAIHFELSLAEDIWIKIEKATPIGIILNELFSNSVTHAFPKGEKGGITVKTSLQQDTISLEFHDNGLGMPDIEKIDHSTSLGIELIQTLVLQLDGRYEVYSEGGTKWLFSFPRGLMTADDS